MTIRECPICRRDPCPEQRPDCIGYHRDRRHAASLARLAARGLDAVGLAERAAENLRHWREHPAPWEPDAAAADPTGDPC